MHALPIPGLPVRAPLVKPGPGETIVGYTVISPANACESAPGKDCGDDCVCNLKLEGWIAVGVLAVLFMPLAWIPCCMHDCALQYQVPVYGQPGTLPTAQGIPVAMVADGARVPLYSKGQSEY